MITYCPCCGDEFQDVRICPTCHEATFEGHRPKGFPGICTCFEKQMPDPDDDFDGDAFDF
jgi:hypothetical protein